ncbi:MAG TPA: transcriptional repressor [Dissulfurispiraceae bacterium]|nr:transcriptional repressor [Dissulfurispiraceae bacterium]
MMKEEYFSELLKELKLKATSKRLAVLSVLSGMEAYASPEEIWQNLRLKIGTIGLPTVYRILEELAGKGVIARIIHPSRQLYYYYCGNAGHHHHFICVSCRKVQDINFCASKEIECEVSGRLNGRVLSHVLQIDGLCRECSIQKRYRKYS